MRRVASAGTLGMGEVFLMRRVASAGSLGMGEFFMMRGVASAGSLGMEEVFSDEESSICLEVGDGRGFI